MCIIVNETNDGLPDYARDIAPVVDVAQTTLEYFPFAVAKVNNVEAEEKIKNSMPDNKSYRSEQLLTVFQSKVMKPQRIGLPVQVVKQKLNHERKRQRRVEVKRQSGKRRSQFRSGKPFISGFSTIGIKMLCL